MTVGPRQANLVLIAYASSEGSGEPAHPRSLARTFAARSYKQWIKRNLQTESQIPGPSEWLGMRSWNLSWRNAWRHQFAWRGPVIVDASCYINGWTVATRQYPEAQRSPERHYNYKSLILYISFSVPWQQIKIRNLHKIYTQHDTKCCFYGCHVTCKVEKKTMISNRHNRIPHSAQDTKWERNTNNYDGIK